MTHRAIAVPTNTTNTAAIAAIAATAAHIPPRNRANPQKFRPAPTRKK